MPLYEYECGACHHRFERIQRFSDPSVDVCPNCGKGPVRKLVSSPAIQFKGSGWYVTDYAKKSSDATKPGAGDSSSASASTSSESATSTATTEGKKTSAEGTKTSAEKAEKKD